MCVLLRVNMESGKLRKLLEMMQHHMENNTT